jgi:Zn ribbon nucleic-acid-binding protein
VSDILRWLNWTPSEYSSGTKVATKPPKPSKPTLGGGSVSSGGTIRPASQIFQPQPHFHSHPEPSSVSSGGASVTISRIFQASVPASDEAQIISETAPPEPPKPSKPTLPQCIKCDSFALYRNQDGSVECMTCGLNATWRDYPKSSAGSFAMGVREAPEVVHFSTGEGRVQSLGTRPEKPPAAKRRKIAEKENPMKDNNF